jgi:hypothetical protein
MAEEGVVDRRGIGAKRYQRKIAESKSSAARLGAKSGVCHDCVANVAEKDGRNPVGLCIR